MGQGSQESLGSSLRKEMERREVEWTSVGLN